MNLLTEKTLIIELNEDDCIAMRKELDYVVQRLDYKEISEFEQEYPNLYRVMREL